MTGHDRFSGTVNGVRRPGIVQDSALKKVRSARIVHHPRQGWRTRGPSEDVLPRAGCRGRRICRLRGGRKIWDSRDQVPGARIQAGKSEKPRQTGFCRSRATVGLTIRGSAWRYQASGSAEDPLRAASVDTLQPQHLISPSRSGRWGTAGAYESPPDVPLSAVVRESSGARQAAAGNVAAVGINTKAAGGVGGFA